ncbi:MAG: acyltransferase family protein [Bifidobacteriaceae bacterium]|nr:acyltransferase family protein [Bifidobacteriaceae bacterium]
MASSDGVAAHRPAAPAGIPPNRPTRLGGLDALRITAALGVLAYHVWAWDSGMWNRDSTPSAGAAGAAAALGIFGVDVFFVISGVVIPIALSGRTAVGFVRAHAVRLLPVYWFAVLAATAANWFLSRQSINAADVAANLTMMHSKAGVPDVNQPNGPSGPRSGSMPSPLCSAQSASPGSA